MLPAIPSLNASLPDANSLFASALQSSASNGLNASAQPANFASGLNASLQGAASETPFASLMTEAVGQVNRLSSDAKTAVDGLMSGSGVDVHQAMIATEKAGMAFEMTLAVRNKAVQAYQSVIGMQF